MKEARDTANGIGRRVSQTVLHGLLDNGLRFDPHYLPSLNSDHMPMALCAMVGLGAEEEACRAFTERYRKILRPVAASDSLERWTDGIGNPLAYPALLNFFLGEVETRGVSGAVATYLPKFISGTAMDAFHPLIRLGYALDFNSAAETAAALAYFASSYREAPVDTVRLSLADELQRQIETGPGDFQNQRFGAGLGEMLKAKRYPVGSEAGLAEIARIALDVYLGTRNFFALHLVTATQAMRICVQHIDETEGVAALTGAMLAAHQVLGSPEYRTARPLAAPGKLDQEHSFKYVWACVSEFRAYSDARYVDEIRAFRDAGLVPAWCAREIV